MDLSPRGCSGSWILRVSFEAQLSPLIIDTQIEVSKILIKSPEYESVHVDDDHISLFSSEHQAAGSIAISQLGGLDESLSVRLRHFLMTFECFDIRKIWQHSHFIWTSQTLLQTFKKKSYVEEDEVMLKVSCIAINVSPCDLANSKDYVSVGLFLLSIGEDCRKSDLKVLWR